MRVTIARRNNLGKLCLVLRVSRMAQRPVDRRRKYDQQDSKQSAHNNVDHVMVAKIDGGKSNQSGKNRVCPKQRRRKFARRIGTHDHYRHVSAGKAVVLYSFKAIERSLKK